MVMKDHKQEIPVISDTKFSAISFISTERPTLFIQRFLLNVNVNNLSHRITTAFTEQEGFIYFANGSCQLMAEPDGLKLINLAHSEIALTEIVDCVELHFIRFAKNPEISMEWALAQH